MKDVVIDLHATVGCHPTSTSEIDSYKGSDADYKEALEAVIQKEIGKGADSRLIAIGEIGLGELVSQLLFGGVLIHSLTYLIFDRLRPSGPFPRLDTNQASTLPPVAGREIRLADVPPFETSGRSHRSRVALQECRLGEAHESAEREVRGCA